MANNLFHVTRQAALLEADGLLSTNLDAFVGSELSFLGNSDAVKTMSASHTDRLATRNQRRQRLFLPGIVAMVVVASFGGLMSSCTPYGLKKEFFGRELAGSGDEQPLLESGDGTSENGEDETGEYRTTTVGVDREIATVAAKDAVTAKDAVKVGFLKRYRYILIIFLVIFLIICVLTIFLVFGRDCQSWKIWREYETTWRHNNYDYYRVTIQKEDVDDFSSSFLEKALAQTKIRKISFKECGLGNEEAWAVAEALKKNNVLVEMDLESNQIGDDGAAAIASALKVNGTLQKLDLTENLIETKGAKALGKALEANRTLQCLSLSKNKINVDGAKALAEALNKKNTGLKHLDLEASLIGDDGVSAIASALRENKNTALEWLYLQSNNISDTGAENLADALKVNVVLKDLSLERNVITDEGAEALAEAMNTNTVLVYFQLNGNKIGDEGRAAINSAIDSSDVLYGKKIGDSGH